MKGNENAVKSSWLDAFTNRCLILEKVKLFSLKEIKRIKHLLLKNLIYVLTSLSSSFCHWYSFEHTKKYQMFNNSQINKQHVVLRTQSKTFPDLRLHFSIKLTYSSNFCPLLILIYVGLVYVWYFLILRKWLILYKVNTLVVIIVSAWLRNL